MSTAQWQTWFEQLQKGSPLERDEAEELLLQVTDPAIIDFVAEQLSRSYGRSARVLLRIARAAGQDAAPVLPAAFQMFHIELNRKLRAELMEFIGGMGQAAKGMLLERQRREGWSPYIKQLFLEPLAALEGDDIDDYLWDIVDGEVEINERLKTIALLGKRKKARNLPALLALAGWDDEDPKAWQRARDNADTPNEKRHLERTQHAAAEALAQLGQDAAPVLPLLTSWLEHGHMGDKRLALELMGHIGTEDAIAMILPHLEDNAGKDQTVDNRGKLQKSAAEALKKLASPALLDRVTALMLDDKAYEYSWRSVADAIAEMVTQGLDPISGFAWVRTLLQGEASERMWYLLCALTNAWPDDERAMLIDYIDSHIAHWDDDLRNVSYRAGQSQQPWKLWWHDAPTVDVAPCWPLVRSLSIRLYEGQASKTVISFLASEHAEKITKLTLTQLRLHRDLPVDFAATSLPALRHLHMETPQVTLKSMERHVFSAPWVAQLETFVIKDMQYTHLYDDKRYHRPPYDGLNAQGDTLAVEIAKDPRVARFGLDLTYR